MFEMHFFSISAAAWPTDSRRKIQELDQNYDGIRHRTHVAGLNALLHPFPLLIESDFDKTITPIALRENVLADRIQPTPTGVVTLNVDIPANDIKKAGLGHLLSEPQHGRHKRRRTK